MTGTPTSRGRATAPMTFLRLYTDVVFDPRFVGLEGPDQAAWLRLALDAAVARPAGILPARATAVRILAQLGFADAESIVTRLESSGALASEAGVALAFPLDLGIDWHMRSPSEEPDRVAERVRRHRAREREAETEGNNQRIGEEEQRRAEEKPFSRLDGGPLAPAAGPDLDSLVCLITDRWGWPRVTRAQRVAIADLAERFGPGECGYRVAIAWLQVEPRPHDPIEFLKEKCTAVALLGRQQELARERGLL